jgi:hypothetical protein
MKFRNNWASKNKQWDKLIIKLRISSIDIFSIEMDKTRSFYCLTILNFTLKNR